VAAIGSYLVGNSLTFTFIEIDSTANRSCSHSINSNYLFEAGLWIRTWVSPAQNTLLIVQMALSSVISIPSFLKYH
jgi:hypothetical protein